MSLLNNVIYLVSTWCWNCVIFAAIRTRIFVIAKIKHNFPLATSLTQDNSAFSQQ